MLLEAIKLPREIAVVHCPAHSKGSSKTKRNKELADKAAKAAACQPIHRCTAETTSSADDWPEINNPAQIYTEITQEEHAQWESWGAVKD